MALSTQPYKGARDFYPEDKRLQNYMFTKLRQAAQSYGYEEYDAPILESLDLYTAKTGEEIVNEQTYNFEDRGGRQVVIRPEMTPTVSRMVAAKRQELSYPLRWFSIPNLWRYERPQRGRLREHWQLNVDIFGVDNTAAELELIQVADALYKSFGATADMYEVRINSRLVMDEILSEYLALSAEQAHAMSKLIDRMNKLSPEAFEEQLAAICDETTARKAREVLAAATIEQLPAEVRSSENVAALSTMLKDLADMGITNARFDVTIMRGFDYYTGIVFEVVDTDPENNRSMMGGGRYDGLVGLFGVDPVPTAGFGLGDVTLQTFLEKHNLLPELAPTVDIRVVLVGDILAKTQPLLSGLRAAGINAAVDLSGRKLGDQFKAAAKAGATKVLIIGEQEIANDQYVLRNLESGEEKRVSGQDLAAHCRA